MIEPVIYALLALGAACTLIGSAGIVRFPDVYNRIHAQTVTVVGGVVLMLLSMGLLEWVLEGFTPYTLKAFLIALFLFLTNPVGSHAIARAAHKSGVKLWPGSVVDSLEERK